MRVRTKSESKLIEQDKKLKQQITADSCRGFNVAMKYLSRFPHVCRQRIVKALYAVETACYADGLCPLAAAEIFNQLNADTINRLQQQLATLAHAFESERELRKRYEDQLAAEREVGHNQAVTLGQHIARLEDQLAAAVEALRRMPEIAYKWLIEGDAGKADQLPAELQCICDDALAKTKQQTDSGKAPSDKPKDETREIIISLMRHALEDSRLSEITASRNSHWHIAEDCRNITIAIDKLLSSIPQSLI